MNSPPHRPYDGPSCLPLWAANAHSHTSNERNCICFEKPKHNRLLSEMTGTSRCGTQSAHLAR
jgi:hypothetical protein